MASTISDKNISFWIKRQTKRNYNLGERGDYSIGGYFSDDGISAVTEKYIPVPVDDEIVWKSKPRLYCGSTVSRKSSDICAGNP